MERLVECWTKFIPHKHEYKLCNINDVVSLIEDKKILFINFLGVDDCRHSIHIFVENIIFYQITYLEKEDENV